MKLLAILRDSLRETLDVKLLYVTLALSVLVSLLVCSITYKPVAVEQYARFQANMLNLAIQSQLRAQPDRRFVDIYFDIEDFQRLDTHVEPWLGNYRFFYGIKISDRSPPALMEKQVAEQVTKVREELRKQITPELLERDLKAQFVEVKVTDSPSDDPNHIRFLVVTNNGTKIKSREEWFHEPSLFFGLVSIPVPLFSLSDLVEFVGDKLVGTWGAALTMLLSTIITAFFIPNMLAKGSIDLLLAKPIHRFTLLLYKFFGGLLFMFLNTVVIMVGIWAGIGLQTGLWIQTFLICIFVFTFQFALFYAVSTLIAVVTRSVIVAILGSVITWAALVLVGWTHWWFIENGRADKPQSTTSHWAYVGYDVIRTILPRYKELDWLTSRMIQEELIKPRPKPEPDPSNPEEVAHHKLRAKVEREVYERQLARLDREYGAYSWTGSLTVTSIFIAFVLGLACWRFATKDY